MSQQDSMNNDFPQKMDLASMSIADHQKQKLKELFPEVFTEGNKIDFDQLKRTLGEMVDGGKERFGMQWAGKADCFKTIQQPSLATLVPCPEESIDFDTTENVFIEGDNLEVLKLLQKSYLGKIKMIYIDPPYNTGKDFIYPDNYSDGLDTYLKYTGQIDSNGQKFSTNTDTTGRFHSNWMNMMYPRISLAINLLKEDGVFLISIDESEIKNLRYICDELFGEENFLGTFIWCNRTTPNDARSNFAVDHEYILLYAKNREKITLKGNKKDMSNYKNPDNDKNGLWCADNPSAASGNYSFEIKNPFTGDVYLPPKNRYWAFSERRVKEWFESGKIVFPKEKGKNFLLKKYASELKSENKPIGSIISGFLTSNGTKELNDIFPEGRPFKYPKPTDLIKILISQCIDSGDIILDFFSGSGTTAHAVMKASFEDKKNYKFICVQIPELISDEDKVCNFDFISDVTKERIRRSANKIKVESKSKTDLFTEGAIQLDLGFRVFKLQKSNFSVWDSSFTTDADQIAIQLEGHVDHISPDAKQQAILFELMLKAGFELTTPIETLTLADKTVYSIAEGALLICLEKQLTLEVMHAIANLEPSRVILLDEGFQNNDQLKTNASLTLKSKGILDFRTV